MIAAAIIWLVAALALEVKVDARPLALVLAHLLEQLVRRLLGAADELTGLVVKQLPLVARPGKREVDCETL